ncbi:hypothetical protein SH2C18_12380 [Clostridium sediminicola]|uniref:homocysteine S-methyltransferase family protein n=1 Tax=Clostridium sediminicola TaxID=3114879 RepID=UPI0031F1DBFA
MSIKDLLGKKILVFDGAMGTMLQNRGLKTGEIPELYNLHKKQIVFEIHKKYIDAGADIITTNTFGANEFKLNDTEHSVEEIVKGAVEIAKEAAGEKFVALDIGPTGKLMAPFGDLTFEKAYDVFKRQIIAGKEAGCDLVLIETMSDMYEARAAILAAKDNSDLPIFCTMTFGEYGRTLNGTDPLTMVVGLEALGVDALGINCSLGPDQIMPFVNEVLKYSSIPVMVQPNAGLPKVENNIVTYDINPKDFAKSIKTLAEKGVSILGGCCGTDERFIYEVKKTLSNVKPKSINIKEFAVVSSATKTVILDEGIKIIGERINPAEKDELKEAILDNDIGYILDEALTQKDDEADILKVNVGLPEIDEKKVMIDCIKELQAVAAIPLQIDSSDKNVIEAAVRVYNGKPIINYVNGNVETMDAILPIAKKYGACLIAGTVDEEGIPSTVEERVEIAKRIIKKSEEYGIPKKNILIDCLVSIESDKEQQVMETLKAIKIIKEKFGVKTTLEISNISYLKMALTMGLDVPSIDPSSEEAMGCIKAFKLLLNEVK